MRGSAVVLLWSAFPKPCSRPHGLHIIHFPAGNHKSHHPPYHTVSCVNDKLLSNVGKLTAEYGKIGGNLNQIARFLNECGTLYNTLSSEVRAALSDLAAFKFAVLQKVGEAIGDIKTYQF